MWRVVFWRFERRPFVGFLSDEGPSLETSENYSSHFGTTQTFPIISLRCQCACLCLCWSIRPCACLSLSLCQTLPLNKSVWSVCSSVVPSISLLTSHYVIGSFFLTIAFLIFLVAPSCCTSLFTITVLFPCAHHPTGPCHYFTVAPLNLALCFTNARTSSLLLPLRHLISSPVNYCSRLLSTSPFITLPCAANFFFPA